jgi:seryl-tRNA synthetase
MFTGADLYLPAQYSVSQMNTRINDTQKQIGAKKKAKEDATDLVKQKADLEKEKKAISDSAAEKDLLLKKKLKTIGNFVHDSVPVENNEVSGRVSNFTWMIRS